MSASSASMVDFRKPNARPHGASLSTVWMRATSIVIPIIAFSISQDYGPDNLLSRVVLSVALAIWCHLIGNLIRSRRDHLVMLCFALFNAMGFIFPGMLQAAVENFPFYSATYPPSVVLNAAILITLYSGIAAFGYLFFYRRSPGDGWAPARAPRAVLESIAVPALAILALAMMFRVGRYYFLEPRVLADYRLTVESAGSPIALIPVAVTRDLGFLTLAVALAGIRSARGLSALSVLYLLIGSAVFYLTNSPSNEARFMFAGFLIALIGMMLDTRRASVKALIVAGYAFGILVAMPFMDVIAGRTPNGHLVHDLVANYSRSLDYDGLQSTMNIMMWIGATGIKWGAQLLSGILFFVPHNMWPGKALPSGVAAAAFIGYPSQNVSAPLPAEFYADFGFAGVVLMSAGLGRLLAFADCALERTRRSSAQAARLPIVVLAGFSSIVARGSLLAIIGPTAAAFFVSLAVMLLITRKSIEPRRIPEGRALGRAVRMPAIRSAGKPVSAEGP